MSDGYLAWLDGEIRALGVKLETLQGARQHYVASVAPKDDEGTSIPPYRVRPAASRTRDGGLRGLAIEILETSGRRLKSPEIFALAKDRDPGVKEKSLTSALSVAFKDRVINRDEDNRYYALTNEPDTASHGDVKANEADTPARTFEDYRNEDDADADRVDEDRQL